MKKKQSICPYCNKVVSEVSPMTGGTVTDRQERRYHYDCWMKAKEEEQKQ